MPNVRKSKLITKKQKREFMIWLINNDLTISKFAKSCGVTRQYIYAILKGRVGLTERTKEIFLKGGYELE